MPTQQEPMKSLSDNEATLLLNTLHKDWIIQNGNLQREFVLPSFLATIDMVNKIATLAEKENHHPNLFIRYKTLIVTLKTHEVDDLSRKDFHLAKLIDQLL